MGVIDQKQEHVAVGGVERGRVLGDIDIGIVLHRVPVEHARHLPSHIARAVSGDLAHGADKLVVPDATIVRPGDGAQFQPAIVGFKGLDQFAVMIDQAMLQVDPGNGGGQLPQIGRGRADQGA